MELYPVLLLVTEYQLHLGAKSFQENRVNFSQDASTLQTWRVGRTLGFALNPHNEKGYGIAIPPVEGSRESQRSAHSPSFRGGRIYIVQKITKL